MQNILIYKFMNEKKDNEKFTKKSCFGFSTELQRFQRQPSPKAKANLVFTASANNRRTRSVLLEEEIRKCLNVE